MTRLTLAIALVVLVVEAAVAGLLLTESDGIASAWIDLTLALPAGLVFGIAGIAALARRPENRTGLYLAAVGFLWPFNVLADAGSDWIFTVGFATGELAWVPFAALVLAYPTGRLETRLDRALPIATGILLFGSALLLLLVDPAPLQDSCPDCGGSAIAVTDASTLADAVRTVNHVGVGLLILLVVVRLLRRWRNATRPQKRLIWPVVGAAVASLVAVGLVILAEELAPGAADGLRAVFFVAFATIPLAFLFGILRVRLARVSAGEVVMALQRGVPLRDALAQALRDPSLEIVYWLDAGRGRGGAGWVDPYGRDAPEPIATNDRAVTLVEHDNAPMAALIFDASLDHESGMVEVVAATARLALHNDRLQAELRAEARLAGALADTAPALLSNVDTDGRILTLNPAALRAAGYEDEGDVVGKRFWDVFIDDWERDEMKARFAAAAPDFPQSEYENTFTNVRGETVVIYWRSSPVVDEAGRVVSIVAGGLDVTDRKRREEEIRSSEERLRAVIESAPVAIVEIDLEDRVLHWNPAATRIFGWSADEIVGRPLPIIPPERAHEFRNLLRGTHTDRSVTGFETARLRRDGTLVDVEISNAPIRNAAGEIVGVMAVFSDVTERRLRAQEAVRQRDFLHAITETVPSFLVAVDADAVIAEHLNNRSFLETFGWAEDELVGKSFLGLIAREDDHGARTAIANAANGVAQPEQESIWYDRAGNERIVAWSARPVLDPDGRHLVLVSGTDVTVRRRQEEEIRASRTRLVEAEDEARRKLERNLHDGAQQRLVALSVALRLAESKLELDPQGAASLLGGARAELGHALEELRELARGIHPAVLTARGLGPALESLVSRMSIPVALEHPGERLAPAVEAAAYYVVAESLTNVAKYAQASEAAVRVSRRDGRVVVTVTDDGVGGANPESGSGLRGLADRVAALDGMLAVESPPGAGTRVRAEIPVPTEDR